MPLSLRPVMNYGWNMGFQCWTALQPLSLAKTAGHFVNNTPAHNYIAASRGDCIRRCFVFFTPDACSFMKTRCQTLQLYQNTDSHQVSNLDYEILPLTETPKKKQNMDGGKTDQSCVPPF